MLHFHLDVIPRYRDKTRDRLVRPWRPGQAADPAAIQRLGVRLAAVLGSAG